VFPWKWAWTVYLLYLKAWRKCHIRKYLLTYSVCSLLQPCWGNIGPQLFWMEFAVLGPYCEDLGQYSSVRPSRWASKRWILKIIFRRSLRPSTLYLQMLLYYICFVGTKQNIVFKIILVLILKGSSIQGRPPLSMEHDQLPFPACSQTPAQTSQTQRHHPQSE